MTSATRWPQSRCCIEACRPADQGATFSEDQGILLPSQPAYWFRSSELRARHSRSDKRLAKAVQAKDTQRLQPPRAHQALIGPQLWSGDRNILSYHYVLAPYSRGTGPLVGAGRGGSIRSGGVGVDGCARSAQQI